MDYDKLIRDSHSLAKEKGWWDNSRSLADITLLIQSEISEALEDYRNGRGLTEIWYEEKTKASGTVDKKPCGIPIELADAAIRIGDTAGHYKWPLKSQSRTPEANFTTGLARINSCVSKVFDSTTGVWISAGDDPVQASYLSDAINHLFAVCQGCGIDLEAAIAEKHEYNITRPHRHGGKLL